MRDSSLPLDYARPAEYLCRSGHRHVSTEDSSNSGTMREKSVYDSFNKLIAAQIRGTTISYFIMQNRIEYKEAECSLRSRIG